jgi:L-fuculose-phosphate aldolase
MTDGHPGTEGEALGSQRAAIADFGRRMIADGLVDGMSGNLSVRSAEGDLVAVTPSGISYDDIGPADICLVRLADGGAGAARTPSTETPMHLAVYRATGAGAVVHTHSPFGVSPSDPISLGPGANHVSALTCPKRPLRL